MYAFLTNVFDWATTGGPQTRARNIETALSCFADFKYRIVKNNFKRFLDECDEKDVIHVQSNASIALDVIRRELPLIVGPNMRWQKTPDEIIHYPKMHAVFIQRPDPAVRVRQPSWIDKIKLLPAMVNENYWLPQNSQKTIDVLTIGKSFNYPEYLQNLRQLQFLLGKTSLRCVHLSRFNAQQYRQKLKQTKVLAYPSPREAGASLANALLEASVMNVPIVGLSSVLLDEYNEWHPSRGSIARSIDDMVHMINDTVKTYQKFKPREWTIQNFGLQAGFNRLKEVL